MSNPETVVTYWTARKATQEAKGRGCDAAGCFTRAKVLREGTAYCGLHDPLGANLAVRRREIAPTPKRGGRSVDAPALPRTLSATEPQSLKDIP